MIQKTYGEMVDAGTTIAAVFDRVLTLHQALKESPVKDRVWTYTWTEEHVTYRLQMNGWCLGQTIEGVPALHVAIEANGWLAILTDMFHGSVVGGPGAEDAVIRALDAEIARVRQPHEDA